MGVSRRTCCYGVAAFVSAAAAVALLAGALTLGTDYNEINGVVEEQVDKVSS